MYSKQQGAAMVKIPNKIDIDHLHNQRICAWWIDLRLIAELLFVSQIYLEQQDEDNMGTTFSTTEKKRKRKSTLVNFFKIIRKKNESRSEHS